jgi:hypothetical protein
VAGRDSGVGAFALRSVTGVADVAGPVVQVSTAAGDGGGHGVVAAVSVGGVVALVGGVWLVRHHLWWTVQRVVGQ